MKLNNNKSHGFHPFPKICAKVLGIRELGTVREMYRTFHGTRYRVQVLSTIRHLTLCSALYIIYNEER